MGSLPAVLLLHLFLWLHLFASAHAISFPFQYFRSSKFLESTNAAGPYAIPASRHAALLRALRNRKETTLHQDTAKSYLRLSSRLSSHLRNTERLSGMPLKTFLLASRKHAVINVGQPIQPRRISDRRVPTSQVLQLVSSIPASRLSSRASMESPTPQGLTFDTCQVDSTCIFPRTCVDVESNQCSGPLETCFCIPSTGLLFCTTTADCPEGELCALVATDIEPVCLSSLVVEELDFVVFDEDTPNPSAPSELTDPPSPSGGFTGDPCESDFDCQGDRQCRGATRSRCDGGSDCFCGVFQLQFCTSSEECVPGEVCASISGDDESYCLSAELVESSDEFFEVMGESSLVPEGSPGAVSVAPLPPTGGGLTADSCFDSSDCQGDRLCEGDNCSLDNTCICFPPVLQECSSSIECVSGEVCAFTEGLDSPLCLSEEFVRTSLGFMEVGVDDVTDVPNNPGVGLTGEACVSDLGCSGARSCLTQEGEVCSFDCICVPAQVIVCGRSADCETGEVCAVTSVESEGGICLSKKVVDDVPELRELVRTLAINPRSH